MNNGGNRDDDLLAVKTDRVAPRIVSMAKRDTTQVAWNSSPYAIQVVDVSYTYGHLSKSDLILKNLNINVCKGQIYALLGPSGCGKTTLLKCITGTILPPTGQIILPTNSTNFKVPGKGVGYMPQELSLFPDLTIQETLWLFGRINGVKSTLLKAKIEKWSKEFGLPPGHRLFGNLSGGQKRRVSLICAFLHDAPLLILDEPTVGIDPILRRTIWNFMLDLTKTRNTTILLTTHYIDEAKDAHIVGLMREGKLLAEASPSSILSQFDETSLERCFYRICVKGEADNEANKICDKDDPESQTLLVRQDNLPAIESNGVVNGSASQSKSFEQTTRKLFSASDMKFVAKKVIPSLIMKNFKLLQRNWFLLVLQFVLPGSTVFLFGLCIGGKVFDLPLAVVNDEDPHDLSLEFLRHLRSHPVLQHPFPDMEKAVQSVKSADNRMVLHIPHDFTYCLRNRIVLGIFTNDAVIKCASVYLHADTTNQIISLEMQNMVIRSFESFEMEFVANYSDASPLVATLPLRIDKPIFGNLDMKFSEYITSSILLVCIHFLASVLTGINLVLERHSGVLERFEVCGVTKTQVFTSQLLMNMIIVLIQVALMLGTQFTVFDTKMQGSFVLAITLIVLQGFCGMVFGFFISSIATDITSGILAGIGVFLPNLILCGFVWPLEGMPKPLMWFARFVPVTQTNEALRSVISRGWGVEHFQVQMGLFSVIFWSAFFLIGALVIFRIQK